MVSYLFGKIAWARQAHEFLLRPVSDMYLENPQIASIRVGAGFARYRARVQDSIGAA